jgi:hypothetical protein
MTSKQSKLDSFVESTTQRVENTAKTTNENATVNLNQPRSFKFGTDTYKTIKGHQLGRGRATSGFVEQRSRKIARQTLETKGQISPIFEHTIIYINGFTDGLNDLQLRKAIIQHGGVVVMGETSSTTHIVATGLSATKAERHKTAFRIPYVVTPHWIQDSIEQGKRCAEGKYRLRA